ncbi:hypothetical protein GCM10022245_40560 [Streptomyces mayteni]
MCLFHLLEGEIDLAGIRDVAGHAQQLRRRSLVPMSDRDAVPRAGERAGEGEPDPPVAAGDQDGTRHGQPLLLW